MFSCLLLVQILETVMLLLCVEIPFYRIQCIHQCLLKHGCSICLKKNLIENVVIIKFHQSFCLIIGIIYSSYTHLTFLEHEMSIHI